MDAAGADSVTVTIPYLMQLIKRHNPRLKVNVSSWARVETVRKAQLFADMGVDSIVLSEEVNRDFKTIEAIRKAVNVPLVLIANPGCLYGCPRSFYHANVMTHGSQGDHESEGFLVDHCYFSCTLQKVKDPVEIVKIRWIRPEDVEDYEMAGVDSLKIIDRYKTTEALISYLKAYTDRSFEGNIIDLLNLPKKKAFLPANVKYILRDEYINTDKLMEFADITDFTVSERLVLDNTRIPSNFLSFFKTKDCASSDCADCGFCALIAKKALTVDAGPLDDQAKKYRNLLESLESGSIYEMPEETKGEGAVWEVEAEKAHSEILEFVPKVFRGTAKKKVEGEIARMAASQGGRVAVGTVIEAWRSATPAPFRALVEDKIKGLSGHCSTTTKH